MKRRRRLLGCLRELVLHGFLECQQFLRAWPLLDALEMRHAVRKCREIEVELHAASETPEEMRVGCREVVEEELTSGEQVIGDLIGLEQLFRGQLADAIGRIRQVASPRRRKDSKQEGMDARGAPRHQRDGL